MENTQETSPTPAVYFASLTIENLKCFKGKHEINLSTPEGKPAMWTVILGNNNTGKTTILRALAWLEAKIDKFEYPKKPSETQYIAQGFRLSLENLTNSSSITSTLFWGKKKIKNWYLRQGATIPLAKLGQFVVYGYGVTRKSNPNSAITQEKQDNTASLFSHDVELLNAEEWLLQLYTNSSNEAKAQLDKIKRVLVGKQILPDVIDFEIVSENKPPFKNYVLFHTDFGKVRLQDLGYGYQSMLSWLVDFMYRMFLRYPESENPLAEPAIVLLDEIDLHLHPDWQRKIIGFLSDIFPQTQFIVTAHSPLIVQSAENINVVMLKKEGENVTIHQPALTNFQGWKVEEILDELMYMDDKTMSERYLTLMQQFNEGMDEEDYHKTKEAFDELDNLLHPRSAKRQLLRLQMTSLPHPDDTTEIPA